MVYSKILPTTTISGAGTTYSKIFGGQDNAYWSVQLIWTSTLNGTLTLWGSNVPSPNEADDTDWVSITLPTGLTGPNGSAGSSLCDVGNSGAGAYRLKFVYSAGSGNLTGHYHGKQTS